MRDRFNFINLLLAFSFLLSSCDVKKSKPVIALSTNDDLEFKIDSILSNLTLQEKFFVEVVYDGVHNVITEDRSFKIGKHLEKYAPKL